MFKSLQRFYHTGANRVLHFEKNGYCVKKITLLNPTIECEIIVKNKTATLNMHRGSASGKIAIINVIYEQDLTLWQQLRGYQPNTIDEELFIDL